MSVLLTKYVILGCLNKVSYRSTYYIFIIFNFYIYREINHFNVIMSQSTQKRRPGGAEKQRIKKNKLLLENAKLCGDIRFMFAKAMVRIYFSLFTLYF